MKSNKRAAGFICALLMLFLIISVMIVCGCKNKIAEKETICKPEVLQETEKDESPKAEKETTFEEKQPALSQTTDGHIDTQDSVGEIAAVQDEKAVEEKETNKVKNEKEKKVKEGATVNVKAPVYETETVYWIKEIDTGVLWWKGTDAKAFAEEKQRLIADSSVDPLSWRWGSGGEDIIVRYEDWGTWTKKEWEAYECEDKDCYIVTYN